MLIRPPTVNERVVLTRILPEAIEPWMPVVDRIFFASLPPKERTDQANYVFLWNLVMMNVVHLLVAAQASKDDSEAVPFVGALVRFLNDPLTGKRIMYICGMNRLQDKSLSKEMLDEACSLALRYAKANGASAMVAEIADEFVLQSAARVGGQLISKIVRWEI